MTKQEINKIIDNLVKNGLTRGEAYMKTRRMFITRIEYAKKNSEAELRFLEDLALLDSICLNR